MKKLLFLLLCTVSIYGQTYQNPTYGTITAKNRIFTTDGTVDLSTIESSSSPSILTTRPKVLIARTIDPLGTVSEHGFGDNSKWNATDNALAYNSFDALIQIEGSSTYDHYSGFQSRPTYKGTGEINLLQGFTSYPRIESGNVRYAYGFRARGVKTGGNIERNYGLWVEALPVGSLETYAIITDGSTPSKFGGAVTMGGILKSGGTSDQILLADDSTASLASMYRLTAVTYGAAGQNVNALLTPGVYNISNSATGVYSGFTGRIFEVIRSSATSAYIVQVQYEQGGSRVAFRSSSNTGSTWSTWLESANNLLTGYVSGAGTVASTDTVLQAIQKLNGNIQNATTPKITITTAVSITTATNDAGGLGQNGRHVVIDNGANVINLTCNGSVTASYGKAGTGAITFVQGSGRTLVQLSGTAVFNGIAGSTATLWSSGTTDYLSINNY